MNQQFKKVDQERVLFFDLECIRRNKELDINSKEFELFQKKTRNRETDEFLPDNEVIEEYRKKAALKMCYTKIISIGVGFIKDGEVHIKALEGTEEEVINQFCTIANSFDYICGANIIAFDLPMIVNNGVKYFDVCEVLPDRFITNGKKPWELKSVLDLMEIFKGTHYGSSTVDEMCNHFEIPSPKSDLDGSMVSEEYWNNGVERINKYVKGDVFACVNLFKRMRFEAIFETFIDKNETVSSEPLVQKQPIFREIFAKGEVTKELEKELLTLIKDFSAEEKERTVEILKGTLGVRKVNTTLTKKILK